MRQMFDHFSEVEAPVKAVAELCQVSGQMLPAHRMVGAAQVVLHIADHGIDPLEDPAGITHGIAAGQYGFMGKPGISYSGKTAQAIGGHKAVSGKMFTGPATDLGTGEISDPAEAHGNGMALQVG